MAKYIQTILNAFTSLDMEKLRLHLKDEYSYNETTKTIFLDALEKVFNQFKNAGNTELMLYKGKCSGSNCPNCGTKGYRFVGKRLMNYMDLLFDIEGHDIKDITECGIFKTNVGIEDLGIRSEIEIRLDDKITFNKTPEYHAKVNAADEAWNEIITSPPQMLDFQDLSYWVDKHSVAYQLIGEDDPFDFPEMKWTPFVSLYLDLKEIRDYISENMEEIRMANVSAGKIKTEDQLVAWLVEHEDIGDGAPFNMKHSLNKKDDYYWWNFQNPVCFKDKIFLETKEFIDYYQKHHNEIFEKYTTYTSEEASILYNMCASKEETKQINSLKFHLQKRKEMESEGIVIPLWINSGYREN